jgi:hypothetical protein
MIRLLPPVRNGWRGREMDGWGVADHQLYYYYYYYYHYH